MTDRELLELAAKAAEIDPNWDGLFWQWNPLTDDGDALRLAVKLRIDLSLWIYTDSVLAKTYIGAGRGIQLHDKYMPPVNDHKEPKGSDPYAAARRAIVRAAAEIGKAMS